MVEHDLAKVGVASFSGNYDLAYQGNNLTITKALLNVIADAKTKVYGDADPSGGGDADGAGMAAVAGLAGARANGSSRSEQAPRRGRLGSASP